jgi:hypothetical protein
MTIVALNSEHFDILENECVTSWLTYSGATAPGSLCPCSLTSVFPDFLALTLQTGHGMANWRLKTGAAVQAALQNLGAILSDPSSFLLSDEQLLALTSPEEQPKQRDEFDFSDDDAALVPSPRHQEKRKKKRKSDGGRVVEGRGRASESRHRNEVRNEEERLRHSSASDSNEEQLVLRSEEQTIASPARSPEREPARRKRVIAAAGSSDSDGELVVGTKERAEPTPVTEVRKRRQVVVSDDDE